MVTRIRPSELRVGYSPPGKDWEPLEWLEIRLWPDGTAQVHADDGNDYTGKVDYYAKDDEATITIEM